MPIQPVDKIWMDGKLVDWEDATVHVLTHALHYGSGVFEGVRAYETKRGAAVFRLQDHIRRLFRSAHVYQMAIPFSQDELCQAVKTGLRLLMRPTERGRSSLFVTITNTFPGCFSVIVSVLELSLTSATWSGAS